ncbi:DUF6537 domain-containing protein [Nitrospina watsonii]|uniref:4Fe-4S ferredoxin-type domain-containing protein n=1 Tax=Nitrospina watsonii TaxID=1323948 RepID=A0ABM9HGQ8_9BACT|nr:DUF6537 domain-containing protein [Nitrospina watsonii]CAI2719329.1 4Fe-4S ferredoxin-type domain-containing protein [Nitrospina watsonii]
MRIHFKNGKKDKPSGTDLNAGRMRRTPRKQVSLEEERYLTTEGPIHLTGIQALVRLNFDNLRLLQTIYPEKRFAYFISGYEGSPLGGLDINLRKVYALLKEWHILHVPGGNEEAGANMMWGSQIHRLFGPSKVDGVLGAWYGKGPGVRRIADVQDHMQMAGLDQFCAAYFISGDDHTSKSSTTPHQTDFIHYANHVPTAYPGNIQEILEAGKRAMLVSMLSGLAINLKLETYVCDGSQEFLLNPDEDAELAEKFLDFLEHHQDYSRHFSPVLLPPSVLANESELLYSKLPMVAEISRMFGLDQWYNRELKSDFGIVATGKSYYDLLGALKELNIADTEVEIFKPLITWPADMTSLREFARGKKELIVIEEKRPFYESHIKNELFNDTHKPVIVGKQDENGGTLFPANGNLDSDRIAQILGPRLALKPAFRNRHLDTLLGEHRRYTELDLPFTIKRPPAYCSGCQHRTALEIAGHHLREGTVDATTVQTRDLDGNPVSIEITPKHLMGIGIGCSTMSIIDSLASNRSVVVGPMESEGLLWMGASAFSFRMHADQGCGDGTYFHSARLNINFIRDAIAHLKEHYDIDDTHQTLLYVDNSVVAMTGGQRPVGQDDPEAAIATIQREGIEHIAVVAEAPEEFKHFKKRYGIEVYPKSETLRVKEEFSNKPGLSVIWYVQKCGIEKMRERRRNEELAPRYRVHVNKEVCEDCGDCGVEAKCSSVWKTDTEFGPKVRIHQFSCIQDMACTKGDCPSYVKVYTRTGTPFQSPNLDALKQHVQSLPVPERHIDPKEVYEVYSVGIGGWGLMTAYEILARAATTEGRNIVKEDDTGLSQKGGEVRNNLKIAYAGHDLREGFKIEAGGASLYICSDLIGAVNPDNLQAASRSKTRAIINTAKVPTMPMIVGKAEYPSVESLQQVIDAHTDAAHNIYVNATDIVESLFMDHKPTNLFLLGVAFQSIGNFPIENPDSIEEGIRKNGVEVDINLLAFRFGRLYAMDPQKVLALAFPRPPTYEDRLRDFRQRLPFWQRPRFDALARQVPFATEYRSKFARQVFELFRFQDADYAHQFVEFVEEISRFDAACFPDRELNFTRSVADHLYHVMAYKDEYRVADLLTRPEEIQAITRLYAPGEIKKIRFLLRPPILEQIPFIRSWRYIRNRFEQDGKWEFPGWSLKLLRHFKFLRGTPFDVFCRFSDMRKRERRAMDIYRRRMWSLIPLLNEKNYHTACEAAAYPAKASGYEMVKELHTEQAEAFWRDHYQQMLQTFSAAPLKSTERWSEQRAVEPVSTPG